MKQTIILTIMALVMITGVSALSCDFTSPMIGKYNSIDSNYNWQTMNLDDVKPIKPNYSTSKIYSIDDYQKIVDDYVNGNLTKIDSVHRVSNKIYINEEALRIVNLNKGDIIVQGPPMNVCGYGFLGVFNTEGELKYAVINDKFNDYSYKGKNIIVDSGKQNSCSEDHCNVSLDVNVDNIEFSFLANESKTVEGMKFTLLKAQDYKEKDADKEVIDWGLGKYARYVIDFGVEEEKIEDEPVQKEPAQKEPKEEVKVTFEEPSRLEKVIVEEKSVWGRFVDWLKGIF